MEKLMNFLPNSQVHCLAWQTRSKSQVWSYSSFITLLIEAHTQTQLMMMMMMMPIQPPGWKVQNRCQLECKVALKKRNFTTC